MSGISSAHQASMYQNGSERAARPDLVGAPRELVSAVADSHWFVVRTRSRQEKVAASMLDSLGITNYLPLSTEKRQWSDRVQEVTVPLFSGYLFVRMNLHRNSKLPVLNVPGVVGFVGNSSGPLPVPEEQIHGVRQVLASGADFTVEPKLEEGDWVRVVRGVLTGVEGRLIRVNSCSRLVISIEMIHKTLAVSISRQDVVPAKRHAA